MLTTRCEKCGFEFRQGNSGKAETCAVCTTKSMPQNKPMSEIKTLFGFDEGYAIIKCKRVAWANVENIVSQLIRSTLEAAVERMCNSDNCENIRMCCWEGCKLREAILKPLNKEKK